MAIWFAIMFLLWSYGKRVYGPLFFPLLGLNGYSNKGASGQFMNRRVPAEMPRLCVEKLRNSGSVLALFALIRNISSRHALDPELIRDF
jgi:hypothetical protein